LSHYTTSALKLLSIQGTDQNNPYLQHEGHCSINTVTFQRHFNLETPLWCTAENVL